MSDTYPSWLPKRPPPPVPNSTYQSSADPHPTIADVFATPGRKPTPRSVRIVSHEVPWREPTGDSAETRVQTQTQTQRLSRGSIIPPPPPRPRFRAPSLRLALLRSPALSMRIRYMFHPVFIFGHLVLQTYFDFNVAFMLLQIASHPGPNNTSRNWSLAATAYIACYTLQIIGVFLLYELIYSFWRRWRVKRPLILPIYFSSPAHNLAALTSYTHFCFFAYIRRSARPPWPSLLPFLPNASSPHLSASPQPSSPQASPQAASPSPRFSDSSSDSSFGFAFSDYIAEKCFWYSQNLPTIVLLLPRAGLSLSLLLANTQPGPGRDPTYFDANGALTGYARGVLFANAAWTLWRTLVLIGSILGLWILSGTACAGICGPRYRWEEETEPDYEPWEKRLSGTYPTTSNDEIQGMSDTWSWKQATRERVREAWEICLTSIRPEKEHTREYSTANVRTREKPIREDEEFEGLEEVLAAVSPRQRGVMNRGFYAPAEGREALSDIIPPVDEVEMFGSQRSRRSDPLRVLPFPFKEFSVAKDGVGATKEEKGKEREDRIPFPSPVMPAEEGGVGEGEGDEEGEGEGEGEGGGEEEGEGDDEEDEEEEIVEGRRTSESMSSLGQPVNTGYPFAFRRTARSSASGRTHTATSPSHSHSHSHSTPAHSHTDSTPSTRPSHSSPSNRETTDSPRSPLSGTEGPFIPLPPRHHSQRRRRRAGTAPSLQTSPDSVDVIDPRLRTRTMSSGSSRFEPEPEALYESEGEEERVDSPVADGSQEEAEKEDSVGLLSTAPSPKTSVRLPLGRRRSRSGSASRSGSGSLSGSGKDGSLSASSSSANSPAGSQSRRSRAQSFVQSLGQRASLGEFGVRSRSSSVARHTGSQYSDSPKSASVSAVGTSPRSAIGSSDHSPRSAADISPRSAPSTSPGESRRGSSGRPSGEGIPGIEHTFGTPGELRDRLEAEAEATGVAPQIVLPVDEESVAGYHDAESMRQATSSAGTSLRRAASDITASEATERARSEMDQSRTDLSTANMSFVTAPMTIDSTTTTDSTLDSGSTHIASAWLMRQHVPGGPSGHDVPYHPGAHPGAHHGPA